MNQIIDLSAVTLVLSVLIPLLNVLLTHVQANGTVKSVVSVLLAAAGAVATWATGVTSGHVTTLELAVVGAGALAAAGGQRWSWLSTVEAQVGKTFPNGLGNPNKTTPQVLTPTTVTAPPVPLP